MEIKQIIQKSINWRHEHLGQTIRLFAGISDGIEGLIIDQYESFIVATIYNPNLISSKENILKILTTIFKEKSILIKVKDQNDSNKFHYIHNTIYQYDTISYCEEDRLKFEIHADPKHDFGLYLDTKAARTLLTNVANEKTILNLFAYTCAFGISAMKGGAKSVTNIDPNKDYLQWGLRNSELNNIILKRYPDTTQDYLARHLRRIKSDKDRPYDLTIVDPPAFLIGRGSSRLSKNMWPSWLQSLKDGKCREFIIIINDKILGRDNNLFNFFREGLGTDIKISTVDQSIDVIGQKCNKKNDSYYFNPAIFYIKRVENI